MCTHEATSQGAELMNFSRDADLFNIIRKIPRIQQKFRISLFNFFLNNDLIDSLLIGLF